MVLLKEMTQSDYLLIKEDIVEELASALIEIGKANIENAKEIALNEQDTVLTNGVKTENHYVYNIFSELNDKVGYIWFYVSTNDTEKIAFIFDIKVFDKYQGKGFGKSSMLEIEKIIRNKNVFKIHLHTLDRNEIANNMYKNLGYNEIEKYEKSMIVEKILKNFG